MHFFSFFAPLPSFLVAGGSSAATIAYNHVKFGKLQSQDSAYLIEHILELVLCQSRALNVLDRAKLPCHSLAIFPLHRRHPLLRQLVLDGIVFPQIDLCADNQARDTGAVVVYFGEPFLAYVLEGCRRCNREADEEDICLRV